MRNKSTLVIGAATALAIGISGCSSKAADDSGGSGDDGGLKTDFGVTDTEITLGAMTDLSGPFKTGGIPVTHGNQLWVDEINANGGICDRQIKLDIRDTVYKADQAVPLYDSMSQGSLGMIQLVGSAIYAALKQKMVNDQYLAWSPTIASTNLDQEVMLTTGATFDVETINGMAFLMEQGLIKNGDKIATIYLDNEAGQNTLLGLQSYAEDHDLELVEAPIASTDTDLTATVTKFKSEGVNAVHIAASPAATASTAVQMQGQGLDVPLLGWSSAFQPPLLSDEGVVSAMQDNFYMTATLIVWASPAGEKVRALYEASDITDPPNGSMIAGYLSGMAWGAILEQACEDGDMTRAGILEARKKVTQLDGEGITGDMDFSDPGDAVTRETIIAQIDPTAEGGLKEVQGLKASEEAMEYKLPFQK